MNWRSKRTPLVLVLVLVLVAGWIVSLASARECGQASGLTPGSASHAPSSSQEASAPPARGTNNGFDPAALGELDPIPVVCQSTDRELLAGQSFPLMVDFADVLTRRELSAYLTTSPAAPALRSLLWQCACEQWPAFVASLNERRARWRDAMIASSSALQAALPHNDWVMDDQIATSHVALVLRMQSERAGIEERFLLDLVACVDGAKSRSRSRIDRALDPELAAGDPLAALAPLIERARARGTKHELPHVVARWSNIDLRAARAESGCTAEECAATEDALLSYERSRAALDLLAFRVWMRSFAQPIDRRMSAWERIEALERRSRVETRSALRELAGLVSAGAADRLCWRCTAMAYPELAGRIERILAWRAKAVHDEPIDELRRAVESVFAMLDARAERRGFVTNLEADLEWQTLIEDAATKLDLALDAARTDAPRRERERAALSEDS